MSLLTSVVVVVVVAVLYGQWYFDSRPAPPLATKLNASYDYIVGKCYVPAI